MCTIAVNTAMFAALTILFIILKCSATHYDQTTGVSTTYGIQVGVQIQPDAIAFPSNVETKSNYYHHHHDYHSPNFRLSPDFQHSPEFHQNHDFHHTHTYPHDHTSQEEGNNDSPEENSQENLGSNSSMIPLDLMWKFNNFTDINEILHNNLVEGYPEEDDEPLLQTRFGAVERSAAIVPKAAGCIPEAQTVKIVSNEDPSVLYIPSCTRIERCGGCCSHSLLSCQPTDTEIISYQVVKTQFVGGSKLKYMGKEVVVQEKHTKCKCSCRVQEKDCNSFQEYKPSECRCACTNTDEEKKCYKENSTKLWNPDICACQCRNILECSTGYRFDTFRCRCMPMLVRRRFAENPEEERTGYKSEALPVLPLTEAGNIKP